MEKRENNGGRGRVRPDRSDVAGCRVATPCAMLLVSVDIAPTARTVFALNHECFDLTGKRDERVCACCKQAEVKRTTKVDMGRGSYGIIRL